VIPVVADADTLFGATTRGLLIHLDYCGLIRLHWSPLILDELSRALVETGRKPDAKAAARHEQLMRAALPHAEVPVTTVQKHFHSVSAAVRSAKDMHVAACAHAIVAGAYYPQTEVVSLVTNNIRDFGVRRLATLGIEVCAPTPSCSTCSNETVKALPQRSQRCEQRCAPSHQPSGCSIASPPTAKPAPRRRCSRLLDKGA
jgi:PIN domain